VSLSVVGRGLEVDGWKFELELEGEVNRILVGGIFKRSLKSMGLQRFNLNLF
jgi:hypothetical protein